MPCLVDAKRLLSATSRLASSGDTEYNYLIEQEVKLLIIFRFVEVAMSLFAPCRRD